MVAVVEFLSHAIKDKPIDGSDCKTLEAARKELGRLRRITGKVVKVLTNATEIVAQNGNSVEPAPERSFQDLVTLARRKNAQSGNAIIPASIANKLKKKATKIKRKAISIDQSFQNYVKVTVAKSAEDRSLIRSVIKDNPIFKEFIDAELEDFIDVFYPASVGGNATVIQQGDIGNKFYIVQSGSLDIFINMGHGQNQVETQVGMPYRRGGAFGELALLYESPRAATIRASEDTCLWVIETKAFKGLQLHIEKKAHTLKLEQLKRVKIGDNLMDQVLNASQLDSMAMATHYQTFESGSTIIKEGDKGNMFYIITKGEVDVYKKSLGTKAIATLGEDSFFGEKALLKSDTRQATCVAAINTECLTLAREDFVTMLGNMDDLLAGLRLSTRKGSIAVPPLSFENEKLPDTPPIAFEDLKIKRVLGEGAFGKVNLSKSKIDGRLFALKTQAKATVIESGSKEKLVTEYWLMRELSHPFIVKCVNAYQDTKYIFFLMVLLPGGDVLDLLDEYEKFPESWTRFYCGTVVLAFEYMHLKRIAYRDLKPENLVLDQHGYSHVVDLGLAKKCESGLTWTMCGTPDYLAPEIIRGKGHDWGVDYWSLGVLIYELSYGSPPFYDEEPANTPQKVLKGTFKIPQHFTRNMIDLVSHLLTDQSRRLGRTQGGARKIRKHPWFDDFNWQALLDRKMKVPWVPEIENIEKLGTKDDGKWDAPESDWSPNLEKSTSERQAQAKVKAAYSFSGYTPKRKHR
mmetsp:Transcript_26765/g.64206  ORF Transcript_26765/g.64206 Transcript_26765/m.64206 type:complete len:745 (+) Transcript_26765:141-2375(+)